MQWLSDQRERHIRDGRFVLIWHSVARRFERESSMSDTACCSQKLRCAKNTSRWLCRLPERHTAFEWAHLVPSTAR